ncbi:tectonin beta-propeller repeat-containing protein 2 isoform X2 [Monodelphis domestica]|uniref:tectonin beta-propeller repeat-containing protein 2 isoform X2 n=1 Tax=Monodelphis domestica TaxID=13616 RepID=UPI0024E1DDA9|nr:tectonin beta-propeller repeat-containing protein 2 isoform X2 [Monodelphis domestica]
MASGTESVMFKEFCPLYYLLNAIPTKIQKGFRSIVVYLTALDTNEDYIAVGSSIGMLYLYCRQLNQMKKYNFEGKTESITVVKLLSCFDDLVAVGTASGRVAVFQLVSSLPGRNKQLRRFDVAGIHKNSITALAWSPNGMKLFSGDDKGKIVFSSLDLDQGICNSSLVLEEPSSIVQLDYSQKVLLVSTLQRSLLFYTEEKSVKQVGTQPRKNTGKFGACFIPGLCKQSDLTLYASRPGLRLWKSDVHGTVQATFILKDVFAGGVKPFELYPRLEPADRGSCTFSEKHLGLVSCFFQDGWVLSWNEYSIYLLDTINQATIAGLEGSGDIVSVSCTENEIFLLKGDRNIIRISSRPEGLGSLGRDGVETLGCPEKIHLQSLDKLGTFSNETRNRGSSITSESRSRSSSVNSIDSSSSFLTSGDQGSSEILKEGQPSHRFSVISCEDFDQELIVKPIKVKKKKKKQESGTRKTPNSLEGTPCYEHQFSDESPHSTTTDQCSMTSSFLGSSLDQMSTTSPDQQSIFSGELHGALQENDSETFSVLEVSESTPDLLDEENESKNEMLKCSHKSGVDIDNLDSNLPVLLSENAETDDIPELKPICFLENDEQNSQESPNEEQVDFTELQKADETKHELIIQDTESTSEKNFTDTQTVPLSPSTLPSFEEFLPGKRNDENWMEMPRTPECFSINKVPENFSSDSYHGPIKDNVLDQQKKLKVSEFELGKSGAESTPQVSASASIKHEVKIEQSLQEQVLTSSDEEDIYARGLPYSSSEASVAELGVSLSLQDMTKANLEETVLLKSDQFAESWMGYSGPGYGILSLVVSEKYVWCLDYKGGLYCSSLPSAGIRWQKFEDAVQQVAVSPSGALLWKIEQKSNKAFACGKVTIKGKRHWYEALPQAVFVALSDDTAWIIRTNGDLYLQTGLSVDRPCARAVKIDCPYPLSQITSRNNVVWALTEQRALLFREGVSSFCPEGEQWKCDIISEKQALEPVCITLGDQQTIWALDIHGNLWFRTGVVSKKPQGDDDHWWQVSITDYVVFDQCSLFQTIIHATHTVATAAQAPVEKVADKLRMAFWSQQLQCQPSLLGVNNSGVWISSGKNEFHVAKGSLVGTYWNNVVPRGTASATKWVFVLASAAPTKEGAIKLVSLSCGNQHIWACDSRGGVYFRVGTQPLNPSLMLPAWITIEPPAQPVGINLVSVHSSPNDQMLWAIDNKWNVYVRLGITEEMPVGTDWEHVPGLQASHLAVSTRTVWAHCANGDVARRYGITDKNPAGDYWKKIPGNMSCLTVTPIDELWAIGPLGYLLQRLTKTFNHSHILQKMGNTSVLLHPDDFEDEWEVI